LKDWKIGKFEDWKIGRLENLKIGKFEGFEDLSRLVSELKIVADKNRDLKI
jgi:hypothetical protein